MSSFRTVLHGLNASLAIPGATVKKVEQQAQMKIKISWRNEKFEIFKFYLFVP